MCFSRDSLSLPAAHHGEVAYLSSTAMRRHGFLMNLTCFDYFEIFSFGFLNCIFAFIVAAYINSEAVNNVRTIFFSSVRSRYSHYALAHGVAE